MSSTQNQAIKFQPKDAGYGHDNSERHMSSPYLTAGEEGYALIETDSAGKAEAWALFAVGTTVVITEVCYWVLG